MDTIWFTVFVNILWAACLTLSIGLVGSKRETGNMVGLFALWVFSLFCFGAYVHITIVDPILSAIIAGN